MIWDMIVFVFVCCFAFFSSFFLRVCDVVWHKGTKNDRMFKCGVTSVSGLLGGKELWKRMSNYGPGCFNSCVKMCLVFLCVFFFGGRCDWRGIVVLDGVEMKKIRKYWKWIIYYIIIYNYYIYIHIYICQVAVTGSVCFTLLYRITLIFVKISG